MTDLDAALTRRTTASAGAAAGRAPRRVWRDLSLAAVAACLLTASTDLAWGQLCECAEPGWMNCSLMGFSSHEPATEAFPQCMAHGSYGGDDGGGPSASQGGRHEAIRAGPGRRPQPHVVRGAVIRPPPSRLPVVQPPTTPPIVAPIAPPAAPPLDGIDASNFDPKTSSQIKPLNCPRGFAAIGATFYGGTRCGAAAPPAPAAGMPAPVASAVAAVAAALDGADDESASDDRPLSAAATPPPSPPAEASPTGQLPEPPPPSQAAAANALNQDVAKSNWSVTWPVAASAGLVVGVPAGVAAFAIRRYGLTLIPW